MFLCALALPSQAQRRTVRYLANYENEPYHFGFLLAYNQMMFTIKTVDGYQNIAHAGNSWPDFNVSTTKSIYVYNLETRQMPGFTVGIIGSKRLGRYFDLRFIPSLSFCERHVTYDFAVEDFGNQITMKTSTKSIFTTFVEFPLNVKYRSKRYNNIGAYLMGGINPKLDLASQKQNLVPNPAYNPDTNPNAPMEISNFLLTRRFDFALEIGTGFDIYNQWFKMGVEIKMSYGLLDVVKADAEIYTAPIDKLSNKMFQISFLFE